jgi:hypothetical protein
MSSGTMDRLKSFKNKSINFLRKYNFIP